METGKMETGKMETGKVNAGKRKTGKNTAAFAVLILMLLLYAGCGREPKALSAEEIARLNTEFFDHETDQMNHMLLCSEYDTPEAIDLSELFYNGVYDRGEGWTIDGLSEEEMALLAEFDSSAPYLDVVKVTAAEMEAVLQEKLGLGLEETQKNGLENFYYLAEYDSYYLVHGDANLDWCTVTSGTWESDDRLVLEYTKEYEGGQWTATLQKTDDGYLFLSNRKTDDTVGASIQILMPEDVKVIPEIAEYDYAGACEAGEARRIRGVLPGMAEGTWIIVTAGGVEYYYGSYDDAADSTELFGYAIVSGKYSLTNGLSVGMTKEEVLALCPAMAILDTEGNTLNEVTGHMGWNSVTYPHSPVDMDEKLEYVDGKDYCWENRFDYIMIADVEQAPDALPLYMALMMQDDTVGAITFYYPTAG